MGLFGGLFGSNSRKKFEIDGPEYRALLDMQRADEMRQAAGQRDDHPSPMSDDMVMPSSMDQGPSGMGLKKRGLFGNPPRDSIPGGMDQASQPDAMPQQVAANQPTIIHPQPLPQPQGQGQGQGGYDPYSPLPEAMRHGGGDLNQYGGYAPEQHRNFGQQLVRALPVIAAGILAPQAAGAIIAHRQSAARERQFDRVGFIQLVSQGISPAQAHIMLTDPKSMAQAYNQQLSPYTLNPGDVRGLPGQGMVRNPAGAEQYAMSLGVQPGTPEWDTAVRDFTLKSNGPTGFHQAQQLQGDRLKMQKYGIDTRSSDSRYGVDTRSSDSRYGVDTRSSDSRYGVDTRDKTERYRFEHTPIGNGVDAGGNRVEAYPGGGTFRYQGMKPPATATPRRGRNSDLIGQPVTRNGRTAQYSISRGKYIDTATGEPIN